MDNPFMRTSGVRPWGPASFEMALPLVLEMDIRPGMRLLEVGGGSGHIAATLARHWDVTVVTLEPWTDGTAIRDHAIRMGVENRVLPMRMKAQNTPFAEATFDAVISIGSFEMIGDERPQALAEMRRVAKFGAFVGIAEPMCRSECAPADVAALDEEHDLAFRKHFRTLEWTSTLFESGGLKVTEARYFSESRSWWMDYRDNSNISDGEKELILKDRDQWLALGMVVGHKLQEQG